MKGNWLEDIEYLGKVTTVVEFQQFNMLLTQFLVTHFFLNKEMENFMFGK